MQEIKEILEQVKANPKDFDGKVFLAECQFHSDGDMALLQLPVRILQIHYPLVRVEPADKTSAEAKRLRRCWWGEFGKLDDYSETFILDSVFVPRENSTVYCKFLEWVK